MKCPKCAYISFDFNQVCPRCSKDITGEQSKLNVPSFRPEPPALLGALIGDTDASGVGLSTGTSTGLDTGEHGMEMSLEDSGTIDTGEVAFDDSQDMDISLEADGSGEFDSGEFGGLEAEAALSDSLEMESPIEEAAIPPEEAVTDFELEGEEEFSVGAEETSLEEPTSDAATAPELAADEEDFGLDLDELSLDESEPVEAVETGEPLAESEGRDMDLDALALDVEEPSQEADLAAAPREDEVALDLDDLEMDEAGELKLDEIAESPEETEEGAEAEALSLEEPPVEGEASEGAQADTGEMEIDLDALSLDAEETAKASDEADKLALDLDDLDIELDLDEPEQKPS